MLFRDTIKPLLRLHIRVGCIETTVCELDYPEIVVHVHCCSGVYKVMLSWACCLGLDHRFGFLNPVQAFENQYVSSADWPKLYRSQHRHSMGLMG